MIIADMASLNERVILDPPTPILRHNSPYLNEASTQDSSNTLTSGNHKQHFGSRATNNGLYLSSSLLARSRHNSIPKAIAPPSGNLQPSKLKSPTSIFQPASLPKFSDRIRHAEPENEGGNAEDKGPNVNGGNPDSTANGHQPDKDPSTPSNTSPSQGTSVTSSSQSATTNLGSPESPSDSPSSEGASERSLTSTPPSFTTSISSNAASINTSTVANNGPANYPIVNSPSTRSSGIATPTALVSSNESHTSNIKVVGGIVGGVIGGLVLIAILVFLVFQKRKKARRPASAGSFDGTRFQHYNMEHGKPHMRQESSAESIPASMIMPRLLQATQHDPAYNLPSETMISTNAQPEPTEEKHGAENLFDPTAPHIVPPVLSNSAMVKSRATVNNDEVGRAVTTDGMLRLPATPDPFHADDAMSVARNAALASKETLRFNGADDARYR